MRSEWGEDPVRCLVLVTRFSVNKTIMSSYKDLEIYQLAFELSIKVHHASIKLPKFELYEQGSQIRRSSKRIKDTIACPVK